MIKIEQWSVAVASRAALNVFLSILVTVQGSKYQNGILLIVVVYSTISLWYYSGLWYGRLGKVGIISQCSCEKKNIRVNQSNFGHILFIMDLLFIAKVRFFIFCCNCTRYNWFVCKQQIACSAVSMVGNWSHQAIKVELLSC